MNILFSAKKIHMVGIGGIGMSGLAKLLASKEITITGSDLSSSSVTLNLTYEHNIAVNIGSNAKNISSDIDVLVYSPAVSTGDPERTEAAKQGITQLSYPEALGLISKERKTITVSGTNGKTTTTSMIIELLDYHKQKPQAIVGEFLQKYNSNFVDGNNDLFVVEACEYKDSFLNIHHDIAVITNITEDHLDYFESLEHIQRSFTSFLANKKGSGVLICDVNLPELQAIIEKATNLGFHTIDYSRYTEGLDLTIPGEHNRQNAAAALAVMEALGNSIELSKEYLKNSFKGAKRRFEYIGETINGSPLYDDYAHNPEGLEFLTQAMRDKFPNNELVMIFEPHLYSRTRDFKNEFARALEKVDTLYLMPTYRAREPQNEEEDFLLAELIDTKKVRLNVVTEPDNFLETFAKNKHPKESVAVTAGAGDVWKKGLEIKKP